MTRSITDTPEPFRIVVGAAHDETSELAMRDALRALWVYPGSRLHLVHAIPLPPTAMAAGMESGVAAAASVHSEVVDALPDALLGKLENTAATLGFRPAASQVEVHVDSGGAADVILRTARSLPADLIIVGCRGRSGVARALLGSTAESVVRDAPCPVLISRPREGRATDADRTDHQSRDGLAHVVRKLDFGAEQGVAGQPG